MLFLLVLLTAAVAFAEHGTGFVPAQDATPLAAPALASAAPAVTFPQPLREWTVMVFANGKNNLAGMVADSLKELEAAGSGAEVNVVAEIGLSQGQGEAGVPWNGVRRIYIASAADRKSMSSVQLPVNSKTDMGNYRSLARFGIWAKQNFPAKRYMFIITGHGQGVGGISPDDRTGHQISMKRLGKAMAAMGGVDVYVMESCLMQMAEVAYEIKDAAKLVIASEEVIPLPGFNFRPSLNALNANPRTSTEETARVFLASLHASIKVPDYAAGSEISTTLSAVDTKHMAELAAKIKAWSAVAMQASDAKYALYWGLVDAPRYTEQSFYDLKGYVSAVGARTGDEALRAASADLADFISKNIVIRAKNRHAETSGGISVFLPYNGRLALAYKRTAFSKASGWYDLLKWMVRNKVNIYNYQHKP